MDGHNFIAPTLCLLGETAKMDSIFRDLTDARFRDYEHQMEIDKHKTEVRHAHQIAIGLAVVVVLLLLILLRDSTMTIADIAAASGFSRTTTFNHDFKVKYELSPSEFRELQEQN